MKICLAHENVICERHLRYEFITISKLVKQSTIHSNPPFISWIDFLLIQTKMLEAL